jgi:hypothetical protein
MKTEAMKVISIRIPIELIARMEAAVKRRGPEWDFSKLARQALKNISRK